MSHETASQIDTELAGLYEASLDIRRKLENEAGTLVSTIDKRPYTLRKHNSISFLDLIFKAQVLLAWGELSKWDREAVEKSLKRIGELKHDLYVVNQQAKVGDAIFEAERWSRFFLVKNTNGHIHSSMQCSTCYHDTRFGWLPELSGLTETAAVEAYGCILCSVCYPSAPVEWTNGISKQAQAEKDARAAEKAQKAAAKAEKAITNPDGTPLRITTPSGWTEEYKTLVAAQRALIGCFKDGIYYPNNAQAYYENAVILANAIGHKTGDRDIEEILTKAEIKAEKIVKKERGY